MSRRAKFIILGCGSSAGVPAIGNWWGQCDPAEPKNTRTRPSVAVLTDKTTLVVDTGPDFRQQINRENLPAPDAIVLTHIHADHIAGLDELRTLFRLNKRVFPLHADASTLETVKRRYDYMFKTTENGFYPSVCEALTLSFGQKTVIGDIEFLPFGQDHGTLISAGLRFGNLGYSTDMKRLDDAAVEALQGVDIWIADASANHDQNNPVHAAVEDVLALNERIGAKQVYLTHLTPMMDYKTLADSLPPGYAPAHDGLTLEITL